MSQSTVADHVGEIIRDVLEQPDLNITEKTTAKDVEGWDSFKQIEILIAVEQAFKMKLSSADMDKLHNVGDLIAAIARKRPA
jgi:acyl carrier protein